MGLPVSVQPVMMLSWPVRKALMKRPVSRSSTTPQPILLVSISAFRSTPSMTRSTSMLSWVASRSQLSDGTTWKYHSISPVSRSRARMQLV